MSTVMDYTILAFFVGVSFVLCSVLFGIAYFCSYRVAETEKNSAYECGFEPFGVIPLVQELQFFVLGVIFLIFDLELLLLYPFVAYAGTHSDHLFLSGFFSVYIFIGLLTLGFVYE